MSSKSFYGKSSTSNDQDFLYEGSSCSHVSETEWEASVYEVSDSSDGDDQDSADEN